MADTVKDKIKNAGKAVEDTAVKAGEKVKAGADKVAQKAADATKAAGNSLKHAGKSLEGKSGA